ncbi:MAG: YraN family protein [Lachnospiraceae bacterium]|nr:YraN family protein [Lachnospiraceae bacterium]
MKRQEAPERFNKRRVGLGCEDLVCDYLKKRGVLIKDRNYKAHRGNEIDIVGMDRMGTWLCIEVKYRRNAGAGSPAESVDIRKQYAICRAFDHYRLYRKIPFEAPVRFDVVAVTGSDTSDIRWIKNAFDYCLRG